MSHKVHLVLSLLTIGVLATACGGPKQAYKDDPLQGESDVLKEGSWILQGRSCIGSETETLGLRTQERETETEIISDRYSADMIIVGTSVIYQETIELDMSTPTLEQGEDEVGRQTFTLMNGRYCDRDWTYDIMRENGPVDETSEEVQSLTLRLNSVECSEHCTEEQKKECLKFKPETLTVLIKKSKSTLTLTEESTQQSKRLCEEGSVLKQSFISL